MPRSDDDIIAAVRTGRTRSYAELIDRYKDRAFALASRMLKNPQDAEEAAQDAFVRAYQALPTFRNDASFGTWFYRILYNGCLSRLKGALSDAWDTEDADLLEEHGASPLEALERDDLLRQVIEAIDRLPAKYATMLSLFYLQDLTHAEICSVTGLPLNNVKVHLHRARRSLIQELQREAIYNEVIP